MAFTMETEKRNLWVVIVTRYLTVTVYPIQMFVLRVTWSAKFQGMFNKGKMHGRGLYTWSDGVTYEGDFTDNHITGKGLYRWIDGR